MARYKTGKITTRLVEGLAPGEIVSDSRLPGYGVRRQLDARVYFVRKYCNGRRHFLSLGEHGRAGMTEAKARQAAFLAIAAIKEGRDPAVERARVRGMPTLAEFAEQFLADRSGKLKPSTLANYRGLLNTHIAPRDERGRLKPGCLGLLRLDQVTHQHVVGLHRSRKATPRAANHTLDFLSSMYSEAATQGFVEENFSPGRRVSRYRIQPRQRFLSEAEFARLGEVLLLAEAEQTEDPYAIAAVRLLIFTGCRRDEILTARWDWLDLDRGLLNLPDSKTGAKSIHLNPPALEVLRRLPRVEGNPYIIAGKKTGQRWVNLRKVWVRIRQKARLPAMPDQHGKPQQVRLHDLRHSYASLLASGGGSLPMIGALLGHANPATTARYAHLAADPLRRLSEIAGNRAQAVLSPPQRSY